MRGKWSRRNLNAIFLLAFLLAVFLLDQFSFLHFERIVVPESVYAGKTCGCQCILDARPWYVEINYWFWLFILSAPLLVFSVLPNTVPWKRSVAALAAVALGYWIAPLAVDLGGEIHKGPFVVYADVPFQKTMDMVHCTGGSGTGARVFVRVFGWLYAVIYTGWWIMLWHAYHKHKASLNDVFFRYDWLSRILVYSSICVSLVLVVLITFVWVVGLKN